MYVVRPGLALTIVMTATFSVPSARAQDINEGRSPAQMFGNVCATCHASPRGLGRQVGAAQLPDYLRQHYTTSREQAAALAGYVASFANQPAAAPPPAAARRPAAEEGRAARPAAPATPANPTTPATRRRTPLEEPRLEEHTAVPAPGSARPPRATETRPPRTRTPAEAAAAQHRPPAPPAAPAPSPPQNGEPHAGNGTTSAIPTAEPEGPAPARTDDIAD